MPRAINIINILLGIVILALLASIAADGLSSRLGKTLQPKNSKEAVAPATQSSRIEDLSFYGPILSSGMFGKASQGPLTAIVSAPVGSAAAAPATAPTELMLLGTVTG